MNQKSTQFSPDFITTEMIGSGYLKETCPIFLQGEKGVLGPKGELGSIVSIIDVPQLQSFPEIPVVQKLIVCLSPDPDEASNAD